ncbi:hypothetical protein RJ641_025628 [Dillenia turbinata]|uniref:F-box domain-containing protein n=1 Tax=Dillenia turbinata TaxID=194707 RepID=A0AAN8W9Q0_9MAGN
MSVLPDELWRTILESGIRCSSLNYRDLCCVSMTSRRLHRLSLEDSFWSLLLASDFPTHNHDLSSSSQISSQKSLYKLRFEKDRMRKLAAHRRAVLRMESQVADQERKLQAIEDRSSAEKDRLDASLSELSNLQRARQASVALNVWQPEVIRCRQKQIVEQCVVPVNYRINALQMEIKLCKQHLLGFDKAYRDATEKLQAAREKLESLKYHPLRDYQFTSCTPVVFNESIVKSKKLKLQISNCKAFGSLFLVAFLFLHYDFSLFAYAIRAIKMLLSLFWHILFCRISLGMIK